MESRSVSTRRYDNRGRAGAAQVSRARVLHAARDLFVANGYTRTTIADIAREGQVSPQTIYSSFGGKAALLKGAYDITLAGDDQDVPMRERPEFQRLGRAGTTDELLAGYAALARSIMTRLGPMLPLIYGTRAVEPDLDELALTAAQERRFGARAFATHAVAGGFLRPGLDADVAADLIWVPNAPETYLLMTRSGDLDGDGYERWLRTSLQVALT